ncbi:MAG: hypothetical protein Q8O84_03640 [Nanoarchaeota archaeon]|nr:hypothetical protein [Nanoarchaeota archaeon]
MNNHTILNFIPKNGCLAIVSKMLAGNNYFLESSREKNYMFYSDNKKNRVHFDLGHGKLIFKYNSSEIKEQDKKFVEKLELSLLENSRKIY